MHQVYKLKELQTQLQEKLAPVLSEPGETRLTAFWLLEHHLKASSTDIMLNKAVNVSYTELQRIDQSVARLLNQEPIQYVLGEAHFYGRTFKVSPKVLVPRRETEELVAMVKQENLQAELNLLDVGTGSGCIAVTLAKEMTKPRVCALEISDAAVRVAEENAIAHQANVAFITGDLFDDQLVVPKPFDIIVSNPPYVRQSEVLTMTDRVLHHEPELALFVSNEHPLRYYEQMVHRCQDGWLQIGGKMYWEINEALGAEMVRLLTDSRFGKIEVRKDMQGKDRFVTATLLS